MRNRYCFAFKKDEENFLSFNIKDVVLIEVEMTKNSYGYENTFKSKDEALLNVKEKIAEIISIDPIEVDPIYEENYNADESSYSDEEIFLEPETEDFPQQIERHYCGFSI